MNRYILAFAVIVSLCSPTIAGDIALLPHVANNTDLKAAKSTAYATITRDGFAAVGDVPALAYASSNSACSLNSGNGDDGSQVKSADNKCWLAVFPTSGADLRQWGVKFDGATDNSATLQAAFNWWALGNKLTCPSGTAKFGTGIAATIASGKGPTLSCAGQDQTFFQFTGGGYGIAITYGSQFSSSHWRDLAILANGSKATNGISLAVGGSSGNPATSPVTDFTNVTLRGSDGFGSVNTFGTAISITSISNVNFYNVFLAGADPAGVVTTGTIGLALNGTASYPGVQYDLYGTSVQYFDTGIEYNANVQGVIIDGGQYINDINVVKVTSNTNAGQLTVGGGAAIHGLHAGIWDTAGITALTITGGAAFAVKSGSAGVKLDKYLTAAIVGMNCFPQSGEGGNGTCVELGSPVAGGVATITGNTFQQTAVGVSLAAGTTFVTISDNVYYGVTTPISNSAVGNNYIQDGFWISTFTPALSCGAGALGAGNSVSGYYKYLSSKTIFYEWRVIIGAAGVGTCTGALILSLPIAAAVGNGGNDYLGSGREMTSGKMLQSRVLDGVGQLNIYAYDNTGVVANNEDIRVSGIYQSQ